MIQDSIGFENDKQMHFIVSLGIVLVFCMFYLILVFPAGLFLYFKILLAKKPENSLKFYQKDFFLLFVSQFFTISFSIVFTAILGVGKETYDSLLGTSGWSWFDIFWDTMGMLTGAIATLVIFVIVDVIYIIAKCFYLKKHPADQIYIPFNGKGSEELL